MIPAGKNPDLVYRDFINQPVFLVNTSGPTPSQFMLESLRFTCAFEGRPLDFFEQLRYP